MKFSSAAAFSSALETFINTQHQLAAKPSKFEEEVAGFDQLMLNLAGRLSAPFFYFFPQQLT
jgi:hypothetical protein